MGMNPRLLRPTPTGFDPRRIAGLQVWLDGSDSSTFTLNGSTVSEWRDKSGNSRHFAQATAAQQPVAASNVKNGRGAVAFTSDWMTGTYTYQIGSIFAVWDHPSTVSGVSLDLAGIVSSRTTNSNRTSTGVLPFNISIPSVNNVAVEPFPTGTVSYRLNGSVPNTASLNNFNTGVGVRTSPDRWQYLSATFTPVNGSQGFTLGGDTFSATARTMQNGHIGEVLFYSAQLSATEVQTVQDYLVRKWGLQ
jgi:hypothetical protein